MDELARELTVELARILGRATPHPDDTDEDRKRDLYHIEAIARRALGLSERAPALNAERRTE